MTNPASSGENKVTAPESDSPYKYQGQVDSMIRLTLWNQYIFFRRS